MSRRLILRPAAEADIEDAYRWYEDQRTGLGAEFLRAIEAILAVVEREPELYAPIHKNARRVLLRRFPYAVFYVIQPQTIEVVGCFHVRRNPRRWRSRL
jgi:plasmid stabilization system protein ParE